VRALQPKEMNQFLAEFVKPMVEKLDRPAKWRHTPSSTTRASHAGIRNLGNICYMNSMMQQLYMVP